MFQYHQMIITAKDKVKHLIYEVFGVVNRTTLPAIVFNTTITVNTLPEQLGNGGREIVLNALKGFTFDELENGDLRITGRKSSLRRFLGHIF